MSKTSAIRHKSGKKPVSLAPIDAEPGQPLYTTVKNALIRAIDGGHFPIDQRLPSTKDLSEQMSVSLVTAHRALRELVGEGFLDRSRGKGTFITDRSIRKAKRLRICVLIHREVSLVDEHHSRLVEGMRQASANLHGLSTEIELTVSHYGTQVTNGADGFLLLDPPEEELDECLAKLPASAAKLVVGAQQAKAGASCIGIDNRGMAELIIDHLVQMGHRRLAFLGSARTTGSNRDLWDQVTAVGQDRGLSIPDSHVIRVKGWRVDEQEKMRLFQLLDRSDSPTALIAAGFYFSLDVYEAAVTLGRSIPQELSIVGIGNPASAAHLSPPLTCIQEPLVELGHAAVNAILKTIELPDSARPTTRTLQPELIIRKSVTRL